MSDRDEANGIVSDVFLEMVLDGEGNVIGTIELAGEDVEPDGDIATIKHVTIYPNSEAETVDLDSEAGTVDLETLTD